MFAKDRFDNSFPRNDPSRGLGLLTVPDISSIIRYPTFYAPSAKQYRLLGHISPSLPGTHGPRRTVRPSSAPKNWNSHCRIFESPRSPRFTLRGSCCLGRARVVQSIVPLLPPKLFTTRPLHIFTSRSVAHCVLSLHPPSISPSPHQSISLVNFFFV